MHRNRVNSKDQEDDENILIITQLQEELHQLQDKYSQLKNKKESKLE